MFSGQLAYSGTRYTLNKHFFLIVARIINRFRRAIFGPSYRPWGSRHVDPGLVLKRKAFRLANVPMRSLQVEATTGAVNKPQKGKANPRVKKTQHRVEGLGSGKSGGRTSLPQWSSARRVAMPWATGAGRQRNTLASSGT